MKTAKFTLFGARQYYLSAEQFYPSPFFQGWVDWSENFNVDQYYKQIIEGGFNYVVGPSLIDLEKEFLALMLSWVQI